MPRAFVNGIHMNYEVAGDGFPLVLIHAWPTDLAIWQLQVPVFSQFYRTIAVDLRGCGLSDKPSDPIDTVTQSDDVVGLLDALGIKQAAVAGISLGGMVAAQMTLDHPERVASSIWIGAPSDSREFFVTIGGETMLIADAYLQVLEPEGYPAFWEKVWKANIGLLVNEEFVKSRLGSYLLKSLFEDRYARLNADPSAIINIVDTMRNWTIRDRLQDVSRPVQVVVGENDPTLDYCKEQAALTKGAEYVLIEDSGHFCILDQTSYFNDVALDFLSRSLS
jgi:3-oxoadipate enol-lactonase